MVYMEAYDKLLESWLTLVQEDEHFPRGCFVQPAVQVFNSYIQCHLAAPDGTRNLVRAVHPFIYIALFQPSFHLLGYSMFYTIPFLFYTFFYKLQFLLPPPPKTHSVTWQLCPSLSFCLDCKWCCIS